MNIKIVLHFLNDLAVHSALPHGARQRQRMEAVIIDLARNAFTRFGDHFEVRLLFEQQVVQLKLNRMHLLTEALRSFVMRVAWEHDHKMHSANPGLCMNFSTDVIQEVSELNLELHADAGVMDARADKLVRDAIIWSHLAGDSVQRMKTTRRLAN